MKQVCNAEVTQESADHLRKRCGLLTPEELKDKRLRCCLSYERADSVFGLSDGSYEKFETGLKLQSSFEDGLIRDTNPFDYLGKCILPN